MPTKYYLDQPGLERLVTYINNALDKKANVGEVPTLPDDIVHKIDLDDYALKEDIVELPQDLVHQNDLNDYALKEDIEEIPVDLVHQNELDVYALKKDIEDLHIENYATDEDVARLEGLIKGIYHFRGSVPNLAALQAVENPAEGDVYNIADTGMNAAWTGEVWDEFGSIVDLSGYVKEEDIAALTIAQINNLLYSGKKAVVSTKEAVEAMIDNNQEKVEITLNSDLTITESITIPEGKEVTLNLEGSEIQSGETQAFVVSGDGAKLILSGEGTISSSSNCTVYAADGGEVVIDGATIVSTNNNCVGSRGAGSLITIESGNLTGQEYGVLAIDGGDVVVNGGTIKGVDNFAIGGNGSPGRGGSTVTINDGVFEGHITSPGYMATAIYWPNEGTLNINGGTIITDGAGIVQRGGTVNIGANTVIQASDNPVDFETGKAGDSRNVVGRYGIVYDYNSKYPAYESMQLNIADGAQISGVDGDIQILPADAPGITDNRQ